MSDPNEPRRQPDYAHDPSDTLTIVPNGDSDDYSRLLDDLQRERMLRVEAQTERDAYKGVLGEYADKRNWGECPGAGDDRDVWLCSLNGYSPALRVLAQFATTAPEG